MFDIVDEQSIQESSKALTKYGLSSLEKAVKRLEEIQDSPNMSAIEKIETQLTNAIYFVKSAQDLLEKWDFNDDGGKLTHISESEALWLTLELAPEKMNCI